MKVKKTYSRKKAVKNSVMKVNNIINNYNITNIITNNYVIYHNFTKNENSFTREKSDSSKSESSDMFDKIMKGPIYNKPAVGSSNHSIKFFSQRQDTFQFYKSDSEFSVSTDISNLLFKDSKNSDTYTPNWDSPPEYRKINNKLVKVKKEKKIPIVNRKKASNRVFKKRLVSRVNKSLTQAPVPCTSSTPNRENALKKDIWPDTRVSPIMPILNKPPSSIHPEHSYHDTNQDKKVGESALGVSALIGGFGNLGLETPRHKNIVEMNNQSLIDYQSPLPVTTNSPIEVVNIKSPPSSPRLRKSEILPNNSESSEEIIGCNSNAVVASPDQKRLVEVNKLKKPESEQFSSPDMMRINNDVSGSTSSTFSSSEGPSDKNSFCSEAIDSSPDRERLKEKENLRKSVSQQLPHKIPSPELVNINKDLPRSSTSLSSCADAHSYQEICVSDNKVSSADQKCLEEVENSNKSVSEQLLHNSPQPDFSNFNNDVPGCVTSTSPCAPCDQENSLKNTMEYYVRSLSRGTKRTAQCDVKVKFSPRPLANQSNETLTKVNLEAGKNWRRSLLRQKQPESKFDRRVSMSADTLEKLIKESTLTSDTKISFNNTTITFDSEIERHETKNNSLSVSAGALEFNLSFSKLTRRRRVYINDMNQIPEESFDYSNYKCDEIELSKGQSLLEQDQRNSVEYENATDMSVNQTDIYESPPILKMNSDALSAISDRKKSRRYFTRSWGDCSTTEDVSDEESEISDESVYHSLLTVLEDDSENSNEAKIKIMGKVGFLICCGQERPIPFEEAFPECVLKTGQKIGEGVFGEVFMLKRPGGRTVIKIIPIEGSEMVNDSPQKRYDEVLSELIITEELSNLRQKSSNFTSGFCEIKNRFFLQGQYPSKLLELWNKFKSKKGSQNQCPDMFDQGQLYLALELAHAGEPIESFSFSSPKQALGIFLQVTFTIAVAESAVDFEHRDLHIGNVLVQPTTEKYVAFVLNGTTYETPTYGTVATIIDYTLSRISFKEDVLYFDLEKDPELFEADGDYQFDIYRDMRADLDHNWRDHQPKTNVRWLHYLLTKLVGQKKYAQKKSLKVYKKYMAMLICLEDAIMDFYSATDWAQYLIDTYSETVSLIRR